MEQARLTCHDIDELAGLYVLDALEPAEMAAVSDHLLECAEAHSLFAELAASSASLTAGVEPLDTPSAMKDRVLAAVAATPQVPDSASSVAHRPARPAVSTPRPPIVAPPLPSMGQQPPMAAPQQPRPAPPPLPTQRPPAVTQREQSGSWLDRLRGGGATRNDGWALAGLAAGVFVIVLVGVGILGAFRLTVDESDRLDLLRQAVAAAANEQANVAVLAGDGSSAGTFGYAVFPQDADGFIVIDGLPAQPPDKAYQAWYLIEGVPASAGLLTLDDDGLGTLTGLDPEVGTSVIAVSVEELPGAEAPTSDPILAGELRTATAAADQWVVL